MCSECSLVAEEAALYSMGSQDAANLNCSTKVCGSHLDSAPLKTQSKLWFTEWLFCFILCFSLLFFQAKAGWYESLSLEPWKQSFFDSKAGLHCYGPKTFEKAAPLPNFVISQRPPCSLIIKTFDWKHATSSALLHSPSLTLSTYLGPPLIHKMLFRKRQWTLTFLPPAWCFLHCFIFHVLWGVLWPKHLLRRAGNFVFWPFRDQIPH